MTELHSSLRPQHVQRTGGDPSMLQGTYPRRLPQPAPFTQPPPYAVPIITPALPEKDARRVLDWQADVARETATVQSSTSNVPPPPPAPPPHHLIHPSAGRGLLVDLNDVAPRGQNVSSSPSFPHHRRAETFPRSPAPGPNTTYSQARTVPQPQAQSPRLVKRETVTEHFHGDAAESESGQGTHFVNRRSSPSDDGYRTRRRSKSRRGEEVDVYPARSSGRRDSIRRDNSRNRSRERGQDEDSRGRNRSRKRYTHYVIPTPPASTRGRNRLEDRSRYTYPQSRPSKEDRARSRSEMGRGPFPPHAINMPIQRLTPPYSHRFSRTPSPPPRRYGHSRSPPRRYDLSPSPPPTPRARRRSPPASRPPQPPASYASHGSSGRRGSVTVKSPSAGVEYVISSEMGATPGLNLGVKGGVTTIRVIPRTEGSASVDWERERDRERERGIERGLEMERERMGILPPAPGNPASVVTIGHVPDKGRSRVPRKMAAGVGVEGLARSVAPSAVGVPAGYATTVIPSDSISSVGSRKGERERLRERMELDRRW